MQPHLLLKLLHWLLAASMLLQAPARAGVMAASPPDVAHAIPIDAANTRTLVVFTDIIDASSSVVRARLIDAATGEVLHDLPLAASGEHAEPTVAFNPSGPSGGPEYLVAYIDYLAGGQWAARIDAETGDLIGSPMQVAPTGTNRWALDLAGDPTSGESLLVWQQGRRAAMTSWVSSSTRTARPGRSSPSPEPAATSATPA